MHSTLSSPTPPQKSRCMCEPLLALLTLHPASNCVSSPNQTATTSVEKHKTTRADADAERDASARPAARRPRASNKSTHTSCLYLNHDTQSSQHFQTKADTYCIHEGAKGEEERNQRRSSCAPSPFHPAHIDTPCPRQWLVSIAKPPSNTLRRWRETRSKV